MLLVVVLPFLHMLNLDVHCEAFSHELNLTAEPFDQHPGMALELIEAIIDRLELLIDRLESPIY